MSLDSQVFPFVLSCPPGFDCFGNSLGAGTITMSACGHTITRKVPVGTTLAQWEQMIAEMTAELAQFSGFCQGGDNPPPPPPPGGPPYYLFFNHSQKCTVFCPDGLPFTYSVPPGLVVGFSQGSADKVAFEIACELAGKKAVCLSNLQVVEFCGDTSLTIIFFAFGGSVSSYPALDFWQINGSLPTGLTFNGGLVSGGLVAITGTATQGGVFDFTLSITTAGGSFQQKQYRITILHIDTASPLPSGTVGTPYSQTLAQTGGVAPISWQLAPGSSLPSGLVLNEESGVISGTPTSSGTTTFTIICQDSAT